MVSQMHDRADPTAASVLQAIGCTIVQPRQRASEQIGHAVRERRARLGLRQDELAELAGVSERFVHTLENGKDTVRLDKVSAVLGALGLELRVERRS